MKLVVPLFVVGVAALASGCSSPDYGNGHLQCAPGSICPSGFYCADDQRCWRPGSGPNPGGGDLAAAAPVDFAGVVLDLAGVDLASPPSTCSANSGVLLCEGFETVLLNGWTEKGSNGMPSVDTSRSYRGRSSLKSHITGGGAMSGPFATAGIMKPFPITGTLYARVWVYFPSPLPAQYEQFLNFTDAGSTGVSVATDSGSVTLDDYAGGIYQVSATKMPLDRWACIQFDMAQGLAAGAVHIRVDGQLLADLPQMGVTTTAVNLLLGLDFNANKTAVPAYDAWFDELIVDKNPTTCDQ